MPHHGDMKLEVYVQVDHERVTLGTVLALAIRLVNTGSEPITLNVMSCEWGNQWLLSTKSLEIVSNACSKNIPVSVVLSPGEKYRRALRVQVRQDTAPGRMTFRAGFRPLGGDHFTWSVPVHIELLSIT